MPKPLNDNLKAVRVETEDGDLLPIMDVAGAKFSELIQAVTSHNKAGKLRLTIDIKRVDSRNGGCSQVVCFKSVIMRIGTSRSLNGRAGIHSPTPPTLPRCARSWKLTLAGFITAWNVGILKKTKVQFCSKTTTTPA